ncbi:MAG TPA: hypothetical protein VF615_30175 [Longimicrobiaceae bacterium]
MEGRRSWMRASPWGRFGAAVAAALAAWLLVGGVAGPLLLPSLAADGVLARGIEAWRASLRDGALILLVLGGAVPAFAALRAGRAERWVPRATAEALGATRAWIAAILLGSVLWEDLPSSAALPRGMLDVDHHWIVGTLYSLPIGFDRLLTSAPGLLAYQALTGALLAAAMLGLFSRWTVPAGAVAYMVFAAIFRSYAWSYHTGLVPLYCLLLLAFTPCGDAFSLDRRLRLRRGLDVEPARVPRMRYGAGRYLVWMAVAVPYTLAGLSKLRNTGFDWWTGEHMKQMLVATVVEPMQFDFRVTDRLLAAPGWAWDALGLSALLGEVFFAVVLVSVLARRVFPLVMAGMHVGILLMQNILFPDLIAIQAVFYDWAPLRERALAAARSVRAAAAGLAARPVPAPALAGAGAAAGDALSAAAMPAAGSASGAAPAPSRTREGASRTSDPAARRQLLVARAFLVVACLAWATRTEKFPLTAMQMFSRPQALEPVEYVRPLVVYADGATEPARFERWIGAVADARYRRLLRDWDTHPERIPLLREFLDACARRVDASAPPRRRIRAFVLETRRWDFRRHPRDPERGAVVAVLRHDVAPR